MPYDSEVRVNSDSCVLCLRCKAYWGEDSANRIQREDKNAVFSSVVEVPPIFVNTKIVQTEYNINAKRNYIRSNHA